MADSDKSESQASSQFGALVVSFPQWTLVRGEI